MELRVERECSTKHSTPGKLYVDGVFECYTLEDPVRPDPNPETRVNEGKVWGETAIPAGRYEIRLTKSPRFSRIKFYDECDPKSARLPEVLNVPGFDGIRIHVGNAAGDTHGCLLVGGSQPDPDYILHSKDAYKKLFTKLVAAEASGIWITYVEPDPGYPDVDGEVSI